MTDREGSERAAVVRRDELRFVELPGRASADPLALLAGAEGSGLSVRIVRMDARPGRRPHRHPHSVEVVHVLDGTGTAWLEGRRTAVGPGDTFLIPTGAAHATLPDPGSTLELLCVFPHVDLGANLDELEEPVLS
jgi:quercetin dioxygenase-like cupin family protein